MNHLPLGKLNPGLLETLLAKYTSAKDPRVIVGPKIGEDAAIIDFGHTYLVAKTDPITFATDEIGWYAVNVNANDIATRGAKPRWFQATILLPEKKTTEELVDNIFSQIASACNELGIVVVGGHTEVSYGLDRPIVVGCMLGEVEKQKLVTTSGAEEGDHIILTKGIAIEGTAIIAREKREELLKAGYGEEFIRTATDYLHNPGISVVRDALLANEHKVHAMHDPTEGGLASGIYEMMHASDKGAIVYHESIPLLAESMVLCREFGLEMLGTIASGALLLAADTENAAKIMELYAQNNIKAAKIGEVRDKAAGIKMTRAGETSDLRYSEKDEITRLFE